MVKLSKLGLILKKYQAMENKLPFCISCIFGQDHKRHSESDREKRNHEKKHATETEDTVASESVRDNEESDFKKLSKKIN